MPTEFYADFVKAERIRHSRFIGSLLWTGARNRGGREHRLRPNRGHPSSAIVVVRRDAFLFRPRLVGADSHLRLCRTRRCDPGGKMVAGFDGLAVSIRFAETAR